MGWKLPAATDEEVKELAAERGWTVERARAFCEQTNHLLDKMWELIIVEHLGCDTTDAVIVTDEAGQTKLHAALTALSETLGKMIGLTYGAEPHLIRGALSASLQLVTASINFAMEHREEVARH